LKIGIFTTIIAANMLIFLRGFLFSAFIFFCNLISFAQVTKYQGVVIDVNKKALAGVNINTDSGVRKATDEQGAFSIQIRLPSKVRFSLLGYSTREILIKEIPAIKDTVILKEEDLKEVVVTANKRGQNINEVSQSMEIIKPKFLIETQTIQLQRALEKIPGIIVQKDQVSIRGASGFSYGAGSRVMVLLDDMPMLSADASDPKWTYYPIENLNQVEILKGAASALYGSAAMEGIIHLRTALAADTTYTMVKLYSGFYDHPLKKDTGFWAKQNAPRMTNGIAVARRQTFGPFKISASAVFNTDDGFRQSDNSYISRVNFFVQYAPPKNNLWLFTFSVNGMEDNGQAFLFYGNVKEPYIPFPGTSSDYTYFRWHADASAKYFATPHSKHILRSRYFTTVNLNNTHQSATGHVWYNEYQYQNQLWKKGSAETNLTAGAVYTYTQTLSDSIYHNHQGRNTAAYIQLDQKAGRFNFNIGGRVEANRVDTFKWDYAPVFRAGINFQASSSTFIRASFGQGFRYPSVAEMFTTTSSGSIKIFANPSLRSEKGWSSELAVRQLFGFAGVKGFIDASAFLSEYKDMIEFVFGNYHPKDSLPFPKYLGFEARNIGNTQIEGFEISTGLEKEFGKLHIDLSGGYTYVLPYNTDSFGKKLHVDYHRYLSFRHKESIKGNLNMQYKKLGIGFYGFYNSPFLNLDQFFIGLVQGLAKDNYWQPYSAGFVLDSRISYKMGRNVNLSFFVKNVFNKEYMEVPGNTNPPRTYQLQMVWEF
jgi:outer membrane receptor protein involved in Fe transport